MKFRLVEKQDSGTAVANRRFKKKHLTNTEYDIKDFLVHHEDDTLVDGAKVTTPSNCVLIEKFPTDVNLTHSLVTNINKCGGLKNFVDILDEMRVLHIEENERIREESLMQYIRALR